jgi:putative tryptophan/tyrosine transport system substrate-binding protein
MPPSYVKAYLKRSKNDANDAAAKVEAVNVLASPLLNASRLRIIEWMRNSRLPAVYQWPESAEDGGLLAYGRRVSLCYRILVSIVDKVLGGANAADLPVEQPVKFDLVVSLKAASAIGMTIAPVLLPRADEVIEH